MKKYLSVCLFLLAGYYSFSQTQMEMNEDAHRELGKADKELNHVYQQILKEYKTDTVFIKNLKTAQQQWIKFRDAEMNVCSISQLLVTFITGTYDVPGKRIWILWKYAPDVLVAV